MNLCRAIALFQFCLSFLHAEDRASEPRGVLNLLTPDLSWQTQTGQWQVVPGKATGTGGETLAELSAQKAVRLRGRSLSFRIGLTGDATKGGVRFSGIRDATGAILRFVVESAAGALTNGRGRTIAALTAADANSTELVLKFGDERVQIHYAGEQLADLPITYIEDDATISLFVERGVAVFQDLFLSAAERALSNAPTPTPARGRRDALRQAEPGLQLTVDFTAGKLTPLKSRWSDYFGVHFDTEPGPWKTIRHYDGPAFGMPPRGRHTGDVKTFQGPFSGQPVQVALADFRDWKRKDARGLDENLRTLVGDGRSGVFIAPWASLFSPAQKDHVWALMKLVYGETPGATERILFQWGDEINYRRLGVAENARGLSSEPRGGVSPQRGANAPEDAVAYAENYFAPAVEALRRASHDVFGDERRIPVLLGSCVRASAFENRAWYARVLDHELLGANAPSLKSRKVHELVDYLTVNYPFHGVNHAQGLQELWERYGQRVKGLWVTEDLGTSSRDTTALLRHAALFLSWVGENRLDAQQARLIWNLPEARRGEIEPKDILRTLGTALDGEALAIGWEPTPSGRIYWISAGADRMLIINAPITDRLSRGRRPSAVDTIKIRVNEEHAAKSWIARLIQPAGLPEGQGGGLAVQKEGTELLVRPQASSGDIWALLVETP